MKKTFILSLIASIAMADVSFDGRAMYFDRGFDDSKPNATALTVGGVLNAETPEYKGITVGGSYFGAFLIEGVTDRDGTVGSSMINSHDNGDLNFIGEAYVQYKANDFTVKVGRQLLQTPLANNHDLRMLPSTYEGATIKYDGITDTHLELGYIRAYTGFGSRDGGFETYDARWGSDGLGYVYGTTKIGGLGLTGQYVQALSNTDDSGETIAVKNYYYGDVNIPLSIGTNSYLKPQFGGNEYNDQPNSFLYGLKAGTDIYGVSTALVFDKITGNNFKAVEAGPMFTDWQQGYGPYEPSTGFGAQTWKQFTPNCFGKLGVVKVMPTGDGTTDDYIEFNADTTYKMTDEQNIRFRYSFKDQDTDATREDRYDFRIIYSVKF